MSEDDPDWTRTAVALGWLVALTCAVVVALTLYDLAT